MIFIAVMTCTLVLFLTNMHLSEQSTTSDTPTTTPPELPMVRSGMSPFDSLSSEYDHLDQVSQMLIIMDGYCKRSCNLETSSRERLRSNLCALCYCDSQCYLYGDCCPDKYVHENRTRAPTLNMECMSQDYKYSFKPHYYMVMSCPKSVDGDALAASCLSNSTSSMVTAIPVTDLTTNITYKNKYCAECNDVFAYKLWRMELDCSNYSFFATAESFLQMYRIAMKNYSCDVTLQSEGISGTRQCSHHSKHMIDKCNVTGKWMHYDKKIISGCSQFFYPVTVTEGQYMNIFCYVCNTDKRWLDIIDETAIEHKVDGFPLTALLDFDDSDISIKKYQKQCPNKEFFDSYNGNCRKIVCPIGKVVRGEKCKSLVPDSFYFQYIICMDVTVRVSAYEYLMIFGIIDTAIFKLLNVTVSWLGLSLAHRKLYPVHLDCENSTVTVKYRLRIRVYTEYDNRDDLEKNLSTTFSNRTLSKIVYDVGNQSVGISLSDACLTQDSADVYDTLRLICDKQHMEFDSSEEKLGGSTKYYADLVVNDMLWCAQVELNSTEYSLEEHSSDIIIEASNKTLTKSEYKHTDRGRVKVCIFNFKRIQTVMPPNVPSSIIGLVSLICTCISLMFLIISVIVYIVIPQLRTAVSRNNITLALNLIAAQALFEFGAEQIEFPFACQIIGILAHYFWLSSVFWMNACTVNLLYRICFPFHSRVQSEMKVFFFLCLYSFISPGIIVIITALSNYFMSGFSGYGHGICYLSNANSRVYGLAIPVGILVSANIVLFIYTIITICRLPKLNSTSNNKVSMIMCVNLSTITGASWVFGYAYEATGFIGFAYAFSVFLGSIGLFLFMSFFANKCQGRLLENVLCRCCPASVTGVSPPTSTAMVALSTDGNEHM